VDTTASGVSPPNGHVFSTVLILIRGNVRAQRRNKFSTVAHH